MRSRQRANRMLRILRRRHRALGVGNHHAACIAQYRPTRDALEQRHAEFLLQERDAPGDRGLRTVQRLRRIRDASPTVNHQERIEGVAVHFSRSCKKLMTLEQITDLSDIGKTPMSRLKTDPAVTIERSRDAHPDRKSRAFSHAARYARRLHHPESLGRRYGK